MPADAAPAAAPFFRALYEGTEGNVFLSSLLNQRRPDGTSDEKRLTTRIPSKVAGFLARWDQPGRAVYFCVNTLRDEATQRSKVAVRQIVALHSDIDLKHLADAPSKQAVVAVLQALPFPPSAIVDSGHGIHAYWLLADVLEATEGNREAVEAALRQLCDVVGGDPGVCEIARLMRVPGSHNSKDPADVRRVTILAIDPTRRYDFADLEEWLSVQSPVIHRQGRQAPPVNPWLAIAGSMQFKPPIDVEERLAAMAYQGAGDSSVHQTQLSVSAALLMRGEALEDVVSLLLDATRATAGEMAERWNWLREEKTIRGMCQSWLDKHGAEVKRHMPSQERHMASQDDEEPPKAPPPGEVINFAAQQQARAKPKPQSTAAPKVGKAEMLARVDHEYLAGHETPIVATAGSIWTHRGDVWKEADEEEFQWVRSTLDECAKGLGFAVSSRLIGEALSLLHHLPGIYDPNVVFDPDDAVPITKGVLKMSDDGLRFVFEPAHPGQYVTWRLAVAYDPNAGQPTRFLQFLLEILEPFGDDRTAIIGFLQEWIGCAFLQPRRRELRKALILHGPARTGKTQFADILRQLYGSHNVTSTSIKQLGSKFGLEILLHVHAWIADDAVAVQEDLADEVFKKVVTGEAITIDRKYRSSVVKELRIPVLLTGNYLPNIRDISQGVFSRLVVIPLTRVFPEDGVIGGRHESIADAIVEAEGSAILQWALGGALRAVKRGRFDLPPVIAAQAEEYRREQNPVLQFIETCIGIDAGSSVFLRDVHAAYLAWAHEIHGDTYRPMSQAVLRKRMHQVLSQGVWLNTQNRPYVTGLMLNTAGQEFRTDQKNRTQGTKDAGTTLPIEQVNRAKESLQNQNRPNQF